MLGGGAIGGAASDLGAVAAATAGDDLADGLVAPATADAGAAGRAHLVDGTGAPDHRQSNGAIGNASAQTDDHEAILRIAFIIILVKAGGLSDQASGLSPDRIRIRHADPEPFC
jgi:hypothetical protein